ncbi:hypothetical protein KC19_2G033000 [Ceratodon purpureus]|uniref:Uncharacterized protein n=1 Tax=Ceratodon purpureus TaxID=3225 RepID=A0A8T0IRD8_CERPU|nr:hypothetical protein KC19_2G033000 [Ceratodon purpureus]
MYLMTLVNSTLVGRRPTGHVELVDLSVEKNKAVERYIEKNGNLRSHGSRSSADDGNVKPSASPRSRRALADKASADLCMEPLFPLFLGSPSSDSSEADTALRAQELRMHKTPETKTLPCLLEYPSVDVVEKKLETASSKQQEQDRRNSDNHSDMKVAEPSVADTAIDGLKTIKPSKTRVTPKLGGLFSDVGISTRVQCHPLEIIAEQELDTDSESSPVTKENTSMTFMNNAERVRREKTDLSPRVLQHPLARIDESPLKERPVKESPVKVIPVKESPVKERKPIMKQKRNNTGAPSPQPVRKVVRDAKPLVKQPEKRERAKARETRAPFTTPRNSKLSSEKQPEAKRTDVNAPSLANPVMEKMPQIASPEPPYAWNKKFQNLPKLAVNNMDIEPMMEERELRYSSPKMTESDAQDDLSFRVWELESKPKRKSISVSRDFQDSLDLESSQDLEDQHTKAKDKPKLTPPQSGSSPGKEKSMENVEVNTQPLPQASSFDLRRKSGPPKVEVDNRHCEEEVQHECPSPSSFTCGHSPTSLFSDDDNMFSRFQQFPNFGPREDSATTICKSPRSVLSQEPDDHSHFASDSSIETRETHHRQRASSSSMYNDESSDLGDSMIHEETEFNRRSFSTFTYTDKDMGETSSDEDHDPGAEFSELRYFQEAGNREPWLGSKDGGVLDDTDLEFLLPPDFKDDDTVSIPDAHEEPVSEISEISPHESPKSSQKHQNTWVPYVTGSEAPTRSPARGDLVRRHSRSSSFSKSQEKLPQRPPKRSVKFAPDLVREMPIYTPRKSIRLPRPESSPVKDEDEQIYPSVKSWEVEEEDNTSTTSTPRRSWRRSPSPAKPKQPAASDHDQLDTAEGGSGPSIMASRSRRWRRSRKDNNLHDPTLSRSHRVAQILPCAGRLFSWSQRMAFKVSRSRRLDSDDESIAESSFGRSARRDAQQVRRILKGSQKKFSNLTVADVLDESFAS